uniref:ParB-like partition protein n=1 Tax=Leptospirillum sp. Group II '5-way CG' TaxID=419541 RepID=B6AP60_9BACT|nr:MAG: ParB-like partition protein [Leptospirillum sp. Group II '5-way CG']
MARKSKFLEDLDFITKKPGTGSSESALSEIPIDRIRFDPDQPRKSLPQGSLQELADSIARHGMLEPVLVRPAQEGAWLLICGERRVRAAQLAGLASVPALVRNLEEPDIRLIQLIENVQREDLPPLEIARAIDEIVKRYGLTQETCAKALGKSRSYVSRHLSLLMSDETTMKALETGMIRDPEAVTLMNRMESGVRQEFLDRALSTNTPITVRAVREELERTESPGRREFSGSFGAAEPTLPYPVEESRPPSSAPELSIDETREVGKSRPPEAKDPVVMIDLPLGVWKKLLGRLGIDPETPVDEIKRRLMGVQ